MILTVGNIKSKFVEVLIIAACLVSTSVGQNCGNVQIACASGSSLACYTDETPIRARCIASKANLLFDDKEQQFDADFLSKLTGKKYTVEDLKREENRVLVEGLNKGEIVTTNGRTIVFTPIQKVKDFILANPDKFKQPSEKTSKNPFEKRFNSRIELDGLEKALKELKKNQGTPNSTPVQQSFLLNVGTDYFKKDNFVEAIRVYKAFLKINPNSETARFNLAESYRLNGNRNKALKNYKKLLKLEPSNIDIVKQRISNIENQD